ncbi:MAG: tetratricopeptide repeat protein [Flavobacteriaceae bacterium]|nr:tetratricopeptide repeat protein [Flavobacteriaceae bacterium]
MRLHKFLTIGVFLIGSHLLCAQETIKNIDSALTVLRKAPQDTSKVILLQRIGAHYNVVHLDSAKTFLIEGYELANKLNDQQGRWANLSTLGVYHERKTQYDSAMVFLNSALKIVEETNSTKGYATVLNNIATVQIRKAEYQDALKNMFEALKAEETLGNRNGIAQAYNNIGIVYYYTANYDKTTYYLTKALEIQEELGNLDGLQNGYNNVGAIFEYQKKYDEAIGSYKKALEISRELGDEKQEATFLSNLALSYSSKGDYVVADSIFRESLTIKEKIKDYNGMVNGYIAFGQLFLKQGKLIEAKKYLEQGIKLSKQYDSKTTLSEGYAALSEVAEKEGKFELANTYLKDYLAIKDSILNEDNARILAETEAKYQTEKKEKEILEQRALLAEKDLEVRQKNTLMYGGFGLALILGLLGYLFYNQQKLKNRQLQKEGELKFALAAIETQNKLQEQRLRISRDLHDNIGAQLTFIISSIDNLKYGFKDIGEKLSSRLSGISSFTGDTIYELRDTIWAMNKNSITFEDLQTRISNFINKANIASDTMKFTFKIASEVDSAHNFTSVQGMNIYRVIQEAVNNAIKYSEAKQINVTISEENKSHLIQIIDDGKGFNMSEIEKGNGLNNMRKRSRDIDATININSEVGRGTLITLVLLK